MDFVEMLEAWTGPTNVQGVERWLDDTQEEDEEACDDRAIAAFLADKTGRLEVLQALPEWREDPPDADA
jgi:hypothetical protein